MEATQTKIAAQDLTPGMVILPPAREISLWIRKHCQDLGLPESAMFLTVISVTEGRADKTGRWLLVRANHSDAWNKGHIAHPWTFKARPETSWPVIAEAN